MKKQATFLGYLLVISFILNTNLFWWAEHGTNQHVRTFADVVWWWFVSSSTVGYGDVAPLTPAGRLAGILTIVTGVYLYTNFVALSAESIHERLNRRHFGKARFKGAKHIVICEYTAFADELLQELDDHPELAGRPVVIVSDLVMVNPYPQHHFVRGVPLSPEALLQANVPAADYIFIFANARFQEPDLKTLHTVSRIQRLNNHARLFIEMHQPKSKFTAHLSGNITIMESKALLEAVLKHQALKIAGLLAVPAPAGAAEVVASPASVD